MVEWADPTTFGHVWSRAVASHDHETFLIFEGPDGHVAEWTYAEFATVVARLAVVLAAEGVGDGSSVHLALPNSPSFVAIWLASIRLGAWIVPSDPMSQTPELADHIERTEPTIGFCSIERAEVYRAAAPESMQLLEIDEGDVSFAWLPNTEFADWPDLDLDDRAAVMFTSGTTGRPKGVEITQANYAFAGKTMAKAAGLAAHDRHIVVLPMFHANAQYYSFASAIWAGASVALIHPFSATRFLEQAARHRATAPRSGAGETRHRQGRRDTP